MATLMAAVRFIAVAHRSRASGHMTTTVALVKTTSPVLRCTTLSRLATML